MKFFFDNTFSHKLVKFLSELALEENLEIVHLRDLFDPSIEDHIWIPRLAEDGNWVIISGDTRIVRNPTNRLALEESGLTIFIFHKRFPSMNRWEQSWRTIKIWPEILKKARKQPQGHIFTINAGWKIL